MRQLKAFLLGCALEATLYGIYRLIRAAFRRIRRDFHQLDGPGATTNDSGNISEADDLVLANMVNLLESTMIDLIHLANELYEGSQDLDSMLSRVVEHALYNLVEQYAGLVSSASVFVRDLTDTDWLICYADYHLNQASKTWRYFIGTYPNQLNRRRGIAGVAYCTLKPQHVHIDPTSRRALDHNEYIDIELDNEDMHSSLVVIPLTLNSTETVYGILCLDSPEPDAFDGDPTCETMAPFIRVLTRLLRWRWQIASAI